MDQIAPENLEPRRVERSIALLIVAGFTLLTHLHLLGFGFVDLDDTDIFSAADRWVQSEGAWSAALTDYHFTGRGGYFRPLSSLLVAAQVQWFGLDPALLHLCSVLLHLLIVLMLTVVLLRANLPPMIAVIGTLVFAVHPVSFARTAWLSTLPDALLAGGFLSATIGLQLLRIPSRSLLGLVLILVGGVAAANGKEAGLLLPVLVVAFLLSAPDSALYESKRRWTAVAAASLGPMLYLILRYAIVDVGAAPLPEVASILSRLFVFPMILGKTILPVGHAVMPLFSWPMTVSGCIVLAASFLVLRGRIAQPQLFWSGLCILLIAALSGLLVRQDFTPVYFENRNYLTLLGVVLVVASGDWAQASKLKRRSVLVVGAALVVIYGLAGIIFSQSYASASNFWTRAVAQSPGHPLAQLNYGVQLQKSGDLRGAQAHYESALILAPATRMAHNNLGALALRRGDLSAAERHFRAEIAIQPDYATAYTNLAIALIRGGLLDQAEPYLVRAVQLDPRAPAPREILEALRADRAAKPGQGPR